MNNENDIRPPGLELSPFSQPISSQNPPPFIVLQPPRPLVSSFVPFPSQQQVQRFGLQQNGLVPIQQPLHALRPAVVVSNLQSRSSTTATHFCSICDKLSHSVFHGIHEAFGEIGLWRMLSSLSEFQCNCDTVSSDGEGEDEDKQKQQFENSPQFLLLRHAVGVIAESMELSLQSETNSKDKPQHVFRHSITTQQRAIVHFICSECFGFLTQSTGFHPKRRVIAVKLKSGTTSQQFPTFSAGRLKGIISRALVNKRIISASETGDAKSMKTTTSLKQPPTKKPKQRQEESIILSDEEEEENDDDDEKEITTISTQSLITKEMISEQTQTLPLESIDTSIILQAVQEQLFKQSSVEAANIPTLLSQIENCICEEFSVNCFSDLRVGTFLEFLSHRELSESLSRLLSNEDQNHCPVSSPILSEFVSQYCLYNGQSSTDEEIARAAVHQFGICMKESEFVSLEIQRIRTKPIQTPRNRIHFFRALSKYPQKQELGTLQNLCSTPLAMDIQQQLSFIDKTKDDNIHFLITNDNSHFGNSRFICFDNGIIIRCEDAIQNGYGLKEAIINRDSQRFVSELISLIVLHGGVINVPESLLSIQTSEGFKAISSSNCNQFILDCLKLLPFSLSQNSSKFIFNVIFNPFLQFGGTFQSIAASTTSTLDAQFLKTIGKLLQIKEFNELSNAQQEQQQQPPPPPPPARKQSKVAEKQNETSTSIQIENLIIQTNSLMNGTKCRSIIDSIRLTEFGIGKEENKANSSPLLETQHKRIARALEKLSADLYSTDTHFLLELIQNADDNQYPEGIIPTIELIFTDNCLVLHNNECGFTESDMYAICDIGKSTKTSEKRSSNTLTGEKGIGFKAVFRVSDAPQIHSNGFHVEFNSSSKPVGYIIPQWIDYEDRFQQYNSSPWQTTITLPWKTDIKRRIRDFATQFGNIEPSSLLFLKRVRRIIIKNEVIGETKSLGVSRDNNKSLPSVVTIMSNEQPSKWIIFEKHFSPTIPRKTTLVNNTTLSFAFQIGNEDGKAIANEIHNIYASLPLCPSGLRFPIHGDFITPASREGIDEDNPWNQWLRSEIPQAFTQVILEQFIKTHSLAVSWNEYLPRSEEVCSFFKPLPICISQEISKTPCILTQEGTFEIPSKVIIASESIRTLFNSKLLETTTNGQHFAHPDLLLSSSQIKLLNQIGVQNFSTSHIISLLNNLESISPTPTNEWLGRLFYEICLLFKTENELQLLRKIKFVPMIGGTFRTPPTSKETLIYVSSETIPTPSAAANTTTTTTTSESVFKDILAFNNSILEALDPIQKSSVQSLLRKLGITQSSAHELIHSIILPSLSTYLSNKNDPIIAKVNFLKTHWQTCSICHSDLALATRLNQEMPILLEDNKTIASISSGVHFNESYKCSIGNVPSTLKGFTKWNIVSSDYLLCDPNSDSWRSFFEFIGISDFFNPIHQRKVLQPGTNGEVIWFGNKIQTRGPCIIEDWICPEFERVINDILIRSKRNEANKVITILQKIIAIFETTWIQLKAKTVAKCSFTDENSTPKSIELSSSLLELLRSLKWIPTANSKIVSPRKLFKKESCKSILGEFGLYPICEISSELSQALGIKEDVSAEVIVKKLQSWSKKQNPNGLTSEQMGLIYSKLHSILPKDALEALFRENAFIFIPGNPIGHCFFKATEVFIDDLTGLFISLKSIYDSSLENVFKSAGVPQYPSMQLLINTLDSLSGTPTKEAALNAIKIFGQIGSLIKQQQQQQQQGQLTENIEINEFIHKLQRKAVFPTDDFHWLSPQDNLFVKDNTRLSETFKSISFLFLPSSPETSLSNEITLFLKTVGIKFLSEEVTVSPVVTDSVPDNLLLEMLSENIIFIQQYLFSTRPRLYEELVKQNFLEKIKSFEAFKVSKLSGTWTISGVLTKQPIPYDALLVDGNKLFHSTNKSGRRTSYPLSVFIELSKAFLGQWELTDSMAHFLKTLFTFGIEPVSKLIDKQLPETETKWAITILTRGDSDSGENAHSAISPSTSTPKSIAEASQSCLRSIIASEGQTVKVAIEDVAAITPTLTPPPTTTVQHQTQQNKNDDVPNEAFNTLTEEQKQAVGKWGEEIVYKLLQEEFPHHAVVWVNEKLESGNPYDIIVSDSTGHEKEFYEVKTTKSSTKRLFEMSSREWMFAYEHRSNFHIYRVFNAFQNNVSVVKVSNPWDHWRDGSLRMWISI